MSAHRIEYWEIVEADLTRRIRVGDEFEFCDGQGRRRVGRIAAVGDRVFDSGRAVAYTVKGATVEFRDGHGGQHTEEVPLSVIDHRCRRVKTAG